MTNSSTVNNPRELSKGYDKGKELSATTKIRDLGSSGITSTATDMAKYLSMLLDDGVYEGRSILSKKYIKAIETNHLAEAPLAVAGALGYGMDIFDAVLTTNEGERIVPMYGHSGYGPPFHADFRYIPDLDLGVVVLVNTKDASIVRSAGTLLGAYLEVSRGMSYQLRHKTPVDEGNQCEEIDLLGTYNMGMTTFEVKKLKKVKLKVDGTKVVLKRIDDSFDYSITAKLLGFIPIKVKGVKFRFKKRGGKMYVSQLDTDLDREEYVAEKTQKVKISRSWEAALGDYDIVETY